MSNPLPNALALATINDGDQAQAAPLRNNFAAIQAAANLLRAALAGGTAGQLMQAVDGTDVQWSDPTFAKIWDTTDSGIVLPAASITTPTLPTNFKHLLIAYEGSSSFAVAMDTLGVRINGDTAAHYEHEFDSANGATAGASQAQLTTSMAMGLLTGSTGGAYKGSGLIFVPNYTALAVHPLLGWAAGFSGAGAGAGWSYRFAGMKGDSATAIQTLTFLTLNGGNITAGSRFTIYGMGG